MPMRLTWLAPPPPPEAAQPLGEELDPAAVARTLVQAADENVLTMVVVGWNRTAWDLLRSEPRFIERKLHWVVSARDAAALEACVAQDPGDGEVVAAAVCEFAEIAQAFAAIGGVFSLAVLSFDSDLLFRLEMLRVDNFVRQTRSLERCLKDFRNLSRRLKARDRFALVESWKDCCRGSAALCVAAGPGLDGSVELLRRLAPGCVVICVDVAYRKLCAAGIRPDYVLNVDTHDAAVSRMEGVPGTTTTLVMPIDGNSRADAWFPQIAHFVPPSLVGPVFGEVGPDFSRGTNVGAATVGWALHLGCSEIVLLGHDLSFPAEAAYSAFVPDHEQHGKDILAKVGRLSPIPGNAGVDVMTDHSFKIACADLAALIRSARGIATVYNYNINLRRGALIEHALPLPDGWAPPATGIRRRPEAAVRPALITGPELEARLDDRVGALMDSWRTARAAGTDALTAIEDIGDDAGLGFARDLLWPAVTGHILHLIRLVAMRSGEPSVAHIRAAEADLDALMDRWAGYVRAQLAGAERTPPPEQLPQPCSRFLALLAANAPRLRQDSFEGSLVPMIARERISLRYHMPDLALPTPPTASEACHIVARVGMIAMPRDLVELLCLCSLEGGRLSFVLDLAVQSGLLLRAPVRAENLAPWLRDAAPAAIGAHDALLALMAGGACPEDDELRRIAAWHPAHLPLIVALLAGRRPHPARVAALERLVEADALPLDDAIVAGVIALHPDPLRVCSLLGSRTSITGPATALAIARRLLDIGDHAGASAQFATIGRIGRCAEDRLAMEGAWLVERGGLDAFLAILAQWPDPEAGYRALYRILAGRLGALPALQALAGDARASIDPNTIGDILSDMASRSQALPAPAAQAMRQLLRAWLEQPRTAWDRAQAEQTLQVVERFAALAASAPA